MKYDFDIKNDNDLKDKLTAQSYLEEFNNNFEELEPAFDMKIHNNVGNNLTAQAYFEEKYRWNDNVAIVDDSMVISLPSFNKTYKKMKLESSDGSYSSSPEFSNFHKLDVKTDFNSGNVPLYIDYDPSNDAMMNASPTYNSNSIFDDNLAEAIELFDEIITNVNEFELL